MPFQLRVTRGASKGTTYSLVDSYSTSIGRSIDCSIQLDDPSVLRRLLRQAASVESIEEFERELPTAVGAS